MGGWGSGGGSGCMAGLDGQNYSFNSIKSNPSTWPIRLRAKSPGSFQRAPHLAWRGGASTHTPHPQHFLLIQEVLAKSLTQTPRPPATSHTTSQSAGQEVELSLRSGLTLLMLRLMLMLALTDVCHSRLAAGACVSLICFSPVHASLIRVSPN